MTFIFAGVIIRLEKRLGGKERLKVEIKTDAKIPIYSYTNKNSNSFFLALYLRAGSMYETDTESGITHFYEHISIRNVNKIMGGKLYEMLDELGLEFNASTYNELVQFYISGAPKHFTLAADILLKLLMPLSLDKEEIDAERARIKAEIREADEIRTLHGFTLSKVFEGTPLSRSIAGTLGSVSKITGNRLENFRKNNFTKENLFIYATGNVTLENLNYLKRALKDCDIPEGKGRDNMAPIPASFGKRGAPVYIKNADFTKVRFTFDVDMREFGVVELDLLYDILLSGYSSEFFIEMSEKRGLFYDVTGSLERYSNIGTFAFSYEVKEKKMYEALELTVKILHGTGSRALKADKCMKAGYVDNAYMLLDDTRELNFTFAYDNHIMKLGYRDIEARRAAYEKVTPEDIRSLAKRLFTRDNLTLTLKGDKNKINIEKINGILALL